MEPSKRWGLRAGGWNNLLVPARLDDCWRRVAVGQVNRGEFPETSTQCDNFVTRAPLPCAGLPRMGGVWECRQA